MYDSLILWPTRRKFQRTLSSEVVMMETLSTSETSVSFYEIICRRIPEGLHMKTIELK
jgi:hypothetical protein